MRATARMAKSAARMVPREREMSYCRECRCASACVIQQRALSGSKSSSTRQAASAAAPAISIYGGHSGTDVRRQAHMAMVCYAIMLKEKAARC